MTTAYSERCGPCFASIPLFVFCWCGSLSRFPWNKRKKKKKSLKWTQRSGVFINPCMHDAFFRCRRPFFSALNTLKAIEFHLVRQMEWTPSAGAYSMFGWCEKARSRSEFDIETTSQTAKFRQKYDWPAQSQHLIEILILNFLCSASRSQIPMQMDIMWKSICRHTFERRQTMNIHNKNPIFQISRANGSSNNRSASDLDLDRLRRSGRTFCHVNEKLSTNGQNGCTTYQLHY